MRTECLAEWLSADASGREAGVRDCLRRIEREDGDLRAWVQVSARAQQSDGPLAGIPFGAKDIIETRGLATEYGSPIYKGRIGSEDAGIVRELTGRGAILLGKTQTTAFAYLTPAATRNPRNLEHTPGGSSSGSAAAVAAGMVPFALGTQTRGSVLRPASYCGITGFKPTFGLFALDGILPFAPSLDTLGFFTFSPKDMVLLWQALDRNAGEDEECALAVPDPLPDVEPEMTAALTRAIQTLETAGMHVRRVDLAPMLARLSEANFTVMFRECAALYRDLFEEYGDRLDDVAAAVRTGLQIRDEQYEDAKSTIAAERMQFEALCRECPVTLVPAATGSAPRGLSFTGDSRMNAPWTALGTPAISIPMPAGNSLPLGLQLTAAPGDDGRLLRAGVRVEEALVRTP
jgi:Asp-tRNA(Asn)/Glu-tRNA(Gln) amidotransferase A subunit family amidase